MIEVKIKPHIGHEEIINDNAAGHCCEKYCSKKYTNYFQMEIDSDEEVNDANPTCLKLLLPMCDEHSGKYHHHLFSGEKFTIEM